ncbi:hypothetical protein GCM10022254_72110 [Actinomadura meridiana]|uniref:Uncharacterized protein n=1 Tax=Actinomadura meridiana TaxID=559626 RepID=A0ABP8CPD1_9ACTN
MKITDQQVAVLRAQLVGNREEHLKLMRQLDPDEANTCYTTLVAAAFIAATEDHFRKDGKVAEESEVIDFVARMRQKDDDIAETISPEIAESMILDILGKGTAVDADPDRMFGHQAFLLAVMVSEREFTDSALDSFLREARELADGHLAN